MGEIAEDIAGGACCGLCMTYFVGEHGHPVLCADCWKDPKARKGWRKASLEEAGVDALDKDDEWGDED